MSEASSWCTSKCNLKPKAPLSHTQTDYYEQEQVGVDLEIHINFQAVIKSAASAASLDLQGSLAVPVVRQPSRRPLAPLDSWILVFGEAALAADLITA